MSEEHIVCPYQKTDGFSFSVCFRCKRYEHYIGSKNVAAHRREQKSRVHKNGFEAAFLLNHLGWPFKVVVDAEKENEGEAK